MDGPTRRELCAGVLGGLGLLAVPGCGDDPAGAPDASTDLCTVYPRQTEGPFFLDGDLLRADITEGRPGTRMVLAISVVRASDCGPLAGVAVDVWQCDAAGVYSGFAGQLGGMNTTGQTFLSGTQLTDAAGRAQFVTIYPGWYPGRTTHIHFKVRQPSSEAVSQLYFPEATTAAVYATAPYAARGPKDTSNTVDGVARDDLPTLLTLADDPAGGYAASLRISVA